LLGKTPPDGQLAAQKLALIARAHANRGDLDLAAAEAQRALELDALTTEAYLLLGLVYLRQNQLPDAVRQFERARYLDSESPLIAYHLAETYRQLQQDDLALREYRNAVRRLTSQPPDALIDGVAVRWLIATCQRYMTVLQSGRYEKGV
jgi:chemotaxis protein methyltransferase CheR